jgi:hypothetical protein
MVSEGGMMLLKGRVPFVQPIHQKRLRQGIHTVSGILRLPISTRASQTPWCVVYTGTHDNDSTLGWYRSEQHAERVALSSDGSEIQQVDNLHLRGNRKLCC